MSEGWRFCAKGSLSIRCWEKECVLYDSTTGDTHLLGRSEADLLNAFRNTPSTIRTFLELEAGFTGSDLQDVLADFEHREFISRA